jgi:hypothetical protein
MIIPPLFGHDRLFCGQEALHMKVKLPLSQERSFIARYAVSTVLKNSDLEAQKSYEGLASVSDVIPSNVL